MWGKLPEWTDLNTKGLKSLGIFLSQDFHEKFMLQIDEISRENVQKESLYFQTILCWLAHSGI